MHLDGPVVLTIAGSDSSGGAGIQADLKTFAALGCYGSSAMTALTAQNTTGVQGVFPIPPDFVQKQINSIMDDLNVRAIKTGMLYDAENAKAVAMILKSRFEKFALAYPPIVCDPVCVSTSGHSLLHPDAIDVIISHLFPLSTVITPNKTEAELLLSHLGQAFPINNMEEMISGAIRLCAIGCQAVLLKGGHLQSTLAEIDITQKSRPDIKVIKHGIPGDNMEILLASSTNLDTLQIVVDVLFQKDGSTTLFVRPRIESSSTHGTGCTLSSAIASELSKGIPLEQAVDNATIYTHHGIQTATAIGSGHGPLNHFHGLTPLLIPQPTASNPYPFTQMLIEGTAKEWKEYVEHDFVKQAGQGTLDRACFIHFVKQDYLYLKYYARAYGLLAAKSTTYGEIGNATKTILNVLHEVGNHTEFCAKFGITAEELENTPEAAATTAYGAFIIDTGLQGDTIKLTMALMACLLGYGEVGLWLKKQASLPNSWVKLEGNPYRHWIEEYGGEMYQDAVRLGLETIEACAAVDTPSITRLNAWKTVWAKCTKLEKGFWSMALELKN